MEIERESKMVTEQNGDRRSSMETEKAGQGLK